MEPPDRAIFDAAPVELVGRSEKGFVVGGDVVGGGMLPRRRVPEGLLYLVVEPVCRLEPVDEVSSDVEDANPGRAAEPLTAAHEEKVDAIHMDVYVRRPHCLVRVVDDEGPVLVGDGRDGFNVVPQSARPLDATRRDDSGVIVDGSLEVLDPDPSVLILYSPDLHTLLPEGQPDEDVGRVAEIGDDDVLPPL